MSENKLYTVSIYTENNIGLLNRISAIFQRRHLNLESITISASEEETIYQESCLFKLKSNLLFDERQIQNIIKESNARIVTVNREFFVIEKSGRKEELELLYQELSAFGIMQFTRSGRIAIIKEEMKISKMLEAFQH